MTEEIRKVYFKEVVEEKEQENFIKEIIESCGIPPFLLKMTPEISFKITNEETGEIAKIYILNEDFIKYL